MTNEKKEDIWNGINKCNLAGFLRKRFVIEKEIADEKFYTTFLEIERPSKVVDNIPIRISESVLDGRFAELEQSYVRIIGHFNSENYLGEDGKRHLKLFVLVEKIEIVSSQNDNVICLEGFICKDTVYRLTPLGREICDVILAVNEKRGCTSYLPCIAWHYNARYASMLSVGSHIQAMGKIQSRIYFKNGQPRETYEVSFFEINLI